MPMQKEWYLEYGLQIMPMIETGEIIAYLDRKWIYEFSKCNKMKYLPRANFEDAGADWPQVWQVINWQHPLKTMLLGVVRRPN
jgi:hypothetical protein